MERRLKYTWCIVALAGMLILGNQSIHLYGLYEKEKEDYMYLRKEQIANAIYEFNMLSYNTSQILSYNATERVLTYVINGEFIRYELTEKDNIREITEQSTYDIRDPEKWTLKNFYLCLQEKIDSTSKEQLRVKFVVQDSTGRIKDTYSTTENVPYECECSLPLGFISGDSLHATYAFPAKDLFKNEAESIILIIGITLLLALCVYSLTKTIRLEKKSGEYRKQFINALVHDLRKPIMNELKISELITKNLDSNGSRILQKNQTQLSRMLESINRLLLQSTDAYGLHLNLNEVDLHDMLQEICSLDQWHTDEKKVIHIQLEYQSDRKIIRADKYFLYAVFQNLIENAIKYSGDHVEIKITCKDLPGGRYQVAMNDNGIGIPPEAREHLFERHNRGLHNGDDKIGGYGLGLFFVKNIIRAHGGRITFQSEVNKGTTFFITLP